MSIGTMRTLGSAGRKRETEAQALHRLAAQAHRLGVKLIINHVTNAHFCTSASRPGALHKVTLYSCDCTGFVRHGRCMHLALVLEHYHSLPPIEPDPDGGGAALPAPADVAVYVVPARSGAVTAGEVRHAA